MHNSSFKLKSVGVQYVNVANQIYALCVFDSPIGVVRATGIATCGYGDLFNQARGEQLARARAELNAYATYRKMLVEKIPKYIKIVEDKYSEALNNLTSYIEHQKDYIANIK